MTEKDFKDLPPEERVKKLKEIKEKKEKEIVEAQQQIKDSEIELSERKKWLDKVPIPELAQEDLTGLSAEARQILKENKNIKDKEIADEDVEDKKKVALEDTVAEETIQPQKQVDIEYGLSGDRLREVARAEYISGLSQVPADRLQIEAERLQRTVEDKGYLNQEEQRRALSLYSAIDEKIKAADGGSYAGWTEETATRALFSKQVTGRLLDNAYQANKPSGRLDEYKV